MSEATHTVRLTSPQAAMIIWNYKERSTSAGLKDPHSVETMHLLSNQIISIQTFKGKRQPSGRFEVRLAPTQNWMSTLTTGSWCAINMTKDLEIPDQSKIENRRADPTMIKWLGRIEDVRLSVSVDEETGARSTSYVVTGSDWSSVFESILYIDPIFRNQGLDPSSSSFTAVGAAARIAYDQQVLDYFQNGGLPTSTINTKAIVRIWGAPFKEATDPISSKIGVLPNLTLTSEGAYQWPFEVGMYMAGNITGPLTQNIADNINFVTGRLTSYDSFESTASDSYTEVEDSFGFINPNSIFGEHPVWSLLMDNCNPVLNELIADLRVEDTVVLPTLYKRIRPFVVNPEFEGSSDVTDHTSYFTDLRRIDIPLEDVITIDAGVNWRSKINFIEIRIDKQLDTGKPMGPVIKKDAQTSDRPSYERDGFKPEIANTKYAPYSGGELDDEGLTKWKYLLREWYFNQHDQLNGNVTFVGQNRYIQVGDNIAINSQVFGQDRNMSRQEKDTAGAPGGEQLMNLVAHVESVRHSFTVDQVTGARKFLTTVQFVRGVIMPVQNLPVTFGPFGGTDIQPTALDTDASELDQAAKKTGNVVSTSTPLDPIGGLKK